MVGSFDDLTIATALATVTCDPTSGMFSFQLNGMGMGPCTAAICLTDEVITLTQSGRFVGAKRSTLTDTSGEWNQLRTEWRLGPSLSCRYTLDLLTSAPVLRARLELTNDGPAERRVRSLRPLVTTLPESTLSGTVPSDWVLFRDGRTKNALPGIYRLAPTQLSEDLARADETTRRRPEDGESEPSIVAPSGTPPIRGEHFVALRRTDETGALLVGFTTLRDQLCQVQVAVDESRNAFSGLEAICQTDNVALTPGASLTSEWLWLDGDSDPFRAIDRYGERVAEENEARRGNASPAGWCSWYFYFADVREEDVIENADWIAGHDKRLTYMQIDEGWNNRHGDWDANEKFPHGMAWLAREIRRRGLRPGLWIAPFLVHADSRVAREHPDWLLRDQAGDLIDPHSAMVPPVLDPTIPEVQDYLRELGHRLVRDWGYEYIKADFLRAVSLVPGARFHGNVTRAQAVRLGLSALRDGMGPEAFLLACGGPYGPTLGLVDGNRTGADTFPEWSAFIWGARQSISRWYMQGRWWVNDCDNICLRDNTVPFREIPRSVGRFSDEEARTAVTLFYLTGGLAMVGERLPMLSEPRRELLNLVLPSLGVAARPRDLFRSQIPTILDLSVTAPHGQWHTVGVVNWDAEPRSRMVPLGDLANCTPGERYHVYEFWTKRYCGRLLAGDSIDLGEVPAHGCRLLLLKAIESVPQLISTEAHLSQGGADIEQWEVRDGELRARANHPFESVRVLAYFPDGLSPDGLELDAHRLTSFEVGADRTIAIALRRGG